MCLPSRVFFLFVCLLLSAPVWAQGSPVVYVSGAGGTILSLNTGTGVASPLITNSSAAYEGLVVGPNNDPGTSAAHRYLLYACDPTHNTIIRLDPNNVAAGTEAVYQGNAGSALQHPQCGRFDSAGDLIVNSKAAGSGTWRFSKLASVPFPHGNTSFPTPSQLGTAISAAQAGQGVTQKYSGDLLAVDSSGNQVVRSTIQLPASPGSGYSFAPSSGFIITNLSNPIGIARNSTGQVYVSNHTSNNKGNVQLFDSTGTFVSTCVSAQTFGNEQPNFLGVAEDGTLYIVAATSSKGFVWSVTQSAGTCTATQLTTTTSLPTLTGIALPPTPVSITLSQPGAGTLSYNYGSNLFNLTTGGACTLTLTKTLVPSPALTTLAAGLTGTKTIDGVNVSLSGGVAVPYLGDGGFATNYAAVDASACQNNPVDFLIAALADQIVFPNPWIIRCDPAGTDSSCKAIDLQGIYFLGGFIPEDLTSHGTGGCCSDFFLGNMNLNSGAQATLNLESPLTQVAPPSLAGTFSSGSTISVKFKFTPTIKNAVAILAVAQVCQPGTPSTGDPICGPNGQASVFPIKIININSSGSSTVPPPIITFSPANQQYQLSLSLKGYAPGIYSLSVITLSNNTPPVTVIVKII